MLCVSMQVFLLPILQISVTPPYKNHGIWKEYIQMDFHRRIADMRRKLRIVLLLTAGAVLLLLLLGMRRIVTPVVTVQGARVVVQDIYNSIYTPGELEAENRSSFAVAQGAEVMEIYVQAGDTVEKGQTLVRLQSETPTLSEETAQDVAEQVLSGEMADAFAPQQAVTENGQRAKNTYDIVADMDGVVLRAPETVGQSILPGICYLEIADVSHLRVRTDIPEGYAGKVQEGQTANVTCSAAPEVTVGATVAKIAPFARRAVSIMGETTTATVSAILELDTQEALRPGYSVEVKIFTGTVEDAVLVPYEAVCQSSAGNEYVFVVRNGIAQKLSVCTGSQLEGYVQIVTGLQTGDVVLCTPPDTLQDGDRVEVTGI